MSKRLEQSVSDLSQAIGMLIRRLRSNNNDGLSLTESSVLKRIERDGPATTADLARAESVKPQSMGATIAALEQEGLVRRKPHPTDGRQMLIELTPRGATVRQQRTLATHAWIAEGIAELPAEDQATLFKAAALLKRLAER